MAYEGFETIDVSVADGVARATIDHAPINLLDLQLMLELHRFGEEVSADESVRCVVFDSANPEFFIAHADIDLLLGLPREERAAPNGELGFFHALVDRFRTMPKPTIGVIEGRARGGGCEFACSLDMRFASRERALFGQPEVALGIIPGGSGTQRLPVLVGRARALEIALGGDDIDAVTAEAWGLVNRALPDGELRPFVDALAARIASFPAHAIAAVKASVNNALLDPVPGLCREEWIFSNTLLEPETIRRMELAMRLGAQTLDVELDVPALYSKLS